MERRRGGHRQSLVHYQELSTSHNPSTHNIQTIVSAFSFGNCRNWNNFMTLFGWFEYFSMLWIWMNVWMVNGKRVLPFILTPDWMLTGRESVKAPFSSFRRVPFYNILVHTGNNKHSNFLPCAVEMFATELGQHFLLLLLYVSIVDVDLDINTKLVYNFIFISFQYTRWFMFYISKLKLFLKI